MKSFRFSDGDSNSREQIHFFQAQVHERNGEGGIPAARRALNDAAQLGTIEANLFGLAFFVQHQVDANGYAQAAGCEVEIDAPVRQTGLSTKLNSG